MKKKQLSSLCAIGVLGAMIMGSCNSNDSNYHTASIIYPSGAVSVLYADDTDDTIQIATTDSWEATISNGSDWITINPATKSGTVKYSYGYYAVEPIYLTTTINNGTERRTGVVNISINGTDDFNNTMGATLVQYPVLNVTNAPRWAVDSEKTLFYYQVTDTAKQVSNELSFVTKKAWTLTVNTPSTKAMSLTPETLSGEGGSTTVKIQVQQNNSTTDTLKSTLILESSGIKTPIYFLQLPKAQ